MLTRESSSSHQSATSINPSALTNLADHSQVHGTRITVAASIQNNHPTSPQPRRIPLSNISNGITQALDIFNWFNDQIWSIKRSARIKFWPFTLQFTKVARRLMIPASEAFRKYVAITQMVVWKTFPRSIIPRMDPQLKLTSGLITESNGGHSDSIIFSLCGICVAYRIF